MSSQHVLLIAFVRFDMTVAPHRVVATSYQIILITIVTTTIVATTTATTKII